MQSFNNSDNILCFVTNLFVINNFYPMTRGGWSNGPYLTPNPSRYVHVSTPSPPRQSSYNAINRDQTLRAYQTRWVNRLRIDLCHALAGSKLLPRPMSLVSNTLFTVILSRCTYIFRVGHNLQLTSLVVVLPHSLLAGSVFELQSVQAHKALTGVRNPRKKTQQINRCLNRTGVWNPKQLP